MGHKKNAGVQCRKHEKCNRLAPLSLRVFILIFLPFQGLLHEKYIHGDGVYYFNLGIIMEKKLSRSVPTTRYI